MIDITLFLIGSVILLRNEWKRASSDGYTAGRCISILIEG